MLGRPPAAAPGPLVYIKVDSVWPRPWTRSWPMAARL
jgi:hypothetical protein